MTTKQKKYRRLTDREVMIANRLKAAFVARGESDGLSQRKMAEGIGWTPGTLNQYLLANVPVNYDALFKMCDYLKVSPHAIDPTLQERVAPPPNKDDLRLMLDKIPRETAIQIIAELAQSLTDAQKKEAAIAILQPPA
jgi:transcriptional regulator with XRE-family HTH domain